MSNTDRKNCFTYLFNEHLSIFKLYFKTSLFTTCNNLFTTDVAAEKNAQNLRASLEGFDTSKLKHAETKEKNPLPDKDGE